MALFTVETAAEMGRRSAALRKQREEQRALILAEPPLQTMLETDNRLGRAERTRKQLDLIDQMIDQSDDADVLDALTRSKERLFRIWAHLAGIPGPGNLKPSSKPSQSKPRTIEPTAMPTPQPAQDNAAQGNVEHGKAVG